ncbi:hypothetical protein [Streptomyces sp. NPDC017993]|uniref:hypothetical protein n=1 Tax=Streptomyces sp. NPDC017993 TaxID=3365027 RepID=UPI0037B6F26C
MNSTHRHTDSPRAEALRATGRLPRRRPTVVLALLLGLFAAAAAPAVAAGRAEAAPRTAPAARHATVDARPATSAAGAVRAAPAAPLTSSHRSSSGHHSTHARTVFKSKGSKGSKGIKGRSGSRGFFKKGGIVALVVGIIFLGLLGLVIWLVFRFIRRAASRRND